ncbi:serine/threonine-protein kinase [Thermogemmatispora carboxidivorans]|uniref:serine/threonine-protein kinase n=1 Tax=Thermogemmatispora carboxidivorans TaxID=1382306 RepID=UPI000699BB5E|nr:serine/threonine-protein kinase [Thermogemmatispora carboxidivorans]
MNELAGQSLGGYLLEEEIGRGSMGMVYRGKQFALGRDVAIKILPHALAKDTSYVARFIREARIIAGLNHPNIVQIYDAGEQKGVLYFVMEYVQGPTLGSLLRLDGQIPQYLAAEYAAQIAEALDCAYSERNVIHRDIKPENLMLDRWGKIKVMDFGLARAPGLQRITVARTLVGSIYYASPEQIWGQPLDNRSDIYALGVVLYEMVTGQRPFNGRTLPEVTQAITSGQLRPPSWLNPQLAPGLEEIILKALARDRTQRYEQARQMAQELRALNLRAEEPPVSTNGGPLSPLPPTNPRAFVVQPPRRPRLAEQRPSFSEWRAQRSATPFPPESSHGQPGSGEPGRTAAWPGGPGYASWLEQPPHAPGSAGPGSVPSRGAPESELLPPDDQSEKAGLWQHFQRLLGRSSRGEQEPGPAMPSGDGYAHSG